jgi:ATP-dependent DNA helicase DinG
VVAEFFAPDGPLAASFPRFEPRPEQVDLAVAVAATISERDKVMAEAGTGIGKTLAYLVPALTSGLRTVVSTGTKNLQEQLIHQDIPIVEAALGRDLEVQVMKGRTNYLCHLRADRFALQPLLPSTAEAGAWESILAWRDETTTGDRVELRALADGSPLWRELTATGDQCTGRRCPDFERCWITIMRRRAQAADLVIVNHHLYMADLALRQRLGDLTVALLPLHELVVFDEAHELDEVAANHFGFQVSERRFIELAHDVRQATAADPSLAAQLAGTLDRLRNNARALFDELPYGGGRTPLPAGPSDVILDRYNDVDAHLEQMESHVASSALEEGPGLARRAALLAAELAFVLRLQPRRSLTSDIRLPELEEGDTFVRYTEAAGRHRALVARPVDVATILGGSLEPLSAVLVSATLAVGGSFDNYRARVGLEQAREVSVGSTFDFENNARLYIPEDLPEPSDPTFPARAAERAAALAASSAGGAFVLCTSHRMLPIARAALEAETRLHVLVQGEAPRSLLIEEFREHGDAVLVATMSFWQGVDVPGSALRLVVIDKLPFASPSDPIVAARVAFLRRHGRDPFMAYQVPQAALLLRQGFGRLIRRHSDRGLVALLDRRVLRRRYGRLFLDSLPRCPHLSRLEEAQRFLAELSSRGRP